MKFSSEQTAKRRIATLLFVLLLSAIGVQANLAEATSPTRSEPEEAYSAPAVPVTLANYTGRLASLRSLVTKCAQQMSTKACDWKQVGPDALVETTRGMRSVQFGWLRHALQSAYVAASLLDTASNSPFRQQEMKVASARLLDAVRRLDLELAQQQESPTQPRSLTAERAALNKILTGDGYTSVKAAPTLFERLRDQFLQWLEWRLRAAGVSRGSEWIVDFLLVSAIVVICGTMVWWFARRVKHTMLTAQPRRAQDPSTPSAQDWQKWFEHGQGFAREQRWREAIHQVYWSAISRLEARGTWPADRARTPREYMQLLAAHPEALAVLSSLTSSFERTWYGNEKAGQQDFERACALLDRLAG